MVTFIRKVFTTARWSKIVLFLTVALSVIVAVVVHRVTTSGMEVHAYDVTRMPSTAEYVTLANTLAYDAQEPEDFADKLGETDDVPILSITLIADGEKAEYLVPRDTVGDFLQDVGVNVRKNDEVTPSLDTVLQEDDVVRVKRRAFITRRVEEPVPAETIRILSFDLEQGEEEIIEHGQDGLRYATYAQVPNDDGSEGEEFLHNEEVLRKPIHKKIKTGFPVKPVSDYDFEYAFDEDGEPVGYKSVLRKQRAAGYSARKGALTASGMKAKVGHVAVDPQVIPYGSKLYIASPDGNFVYGYAIAADTGTALTQGLIGVDLFYDTYEASANNGIKNVDIFILE